MSNGSLDTSFGQNGISQELTNAGSKGRKMELLPDGSTLQFGSDQFSFTNGTIIKRDSTGMLDTSFGVSGVQVIPHQNDWQSYFGGVSIPGGRILAYGHTATGGTKQMLLTRLTTDPLAERFVDLGQDTNICAGSSLVLDAGPGESWTWSTGDSVQSIMVDTTGSFSVTVLDQNGCTDGDTIHLIQLGAPPPPDIILTQGVQLSTSTSGMLQWYLNGNPISGATSSSHTALVNGDYFVQFTDLNGCSNNSDTLNVNAVGVSEETAPVQVSIFPNPSNSNELQINGLSGITSAEVLDSSGRMVPIRFSSTRITMPLNSKGIFTIRIHHGDGTFSHARFVLN